MSGNGNFFGQQMVVMQSSGGIPSGGTGRDRRRMYSGQNDYDEDDPVNNIVDVNYSPNEIDDFINWRNGEPSLLGIAGHMLKESVKLGLKSKVNNMKHKVSGFFGKGPKRR